MIQLSNEPHFVYCCRGVDLHGGGRVPAPGGLGGARRGSFHLFLPLRCAR